MGRKNPIVGLAYVVTSQQEMLEAAKEQYNELLKKYTKLEAQRYGKNKIEQLEAENEELAKKYDDLINKTYRYGSVEFTVKDAENFFIMAQNRINELEQVKSENARLLQFKIEELKEELEEEKKRHWHWQKWDPDKEYPFGKQGCAPLITALYQYSEDSNDSFYDFVNKVNVPLAGKYGVNRICVEPVPERGVFKIKPVLSNAQLVAVCLHYNDKLAVLDELPELEE